MMTAFRDTHGAAFRVSHRFQKQSVNLHESCTISFKQWAMDIRRRHGHWHLITNPPACDIFCLRINVLRIFFVLNTFLNS